jgi:ABC-type Fe3+-hydroxamate transport system substrate-binding protein
MNDDDTTDTGHEAPTRRDYMKYGGAVVGGGLLAGCAGDSENGNATEPTATRTETATETEKATTPDSSYEVCMSPVGCVEFEEPPETVFTRLTHLAGMAFALGRGDDVNAMHAPDYYDALWNQFVERLPGVSLDWSGLYSSWNPDKEKLYELDSDVHLADPAWVTQNESWKRQDIEEIAENVSPWFGNSLSDRHQEPPADWDEGYEYYGIWKQFERVAAAFREEDRYDALAAIRADVLDRIESDLPPANERPTVAMAGLSDVESPYVYMTDSPGFLTAHVRPLSPVDAFGDDVSSGDQVDMEAMLEADPEIILALGGLSPGTDMAGIRTDLENHEIGQEITAVKAGRIYPQGARYQGPVLNLFQLEMTAKQLYPGRFGEWPSYVEGPYPEIPADEQLFDRQRVADIVNGVFNSE